MGSIDELKEPLLPMMTLGTTESIQTDEPAEGPSPLFDPYGMLNLNFDFESPEYLLKVQGTSIEYRNIKPTYMKPHKKLTKQEIIVETQATDTPRKSWMRVADGVINIEIENLCPLETIVKVFVQRTDGSLTKALSKPGGHKLFVKSAVDLPVLETKTLSNTKWDLTVNLDSVFEVTELEGGVQVPKEVYSLCTHAIESTNMFQLLTEVFARQLGSNGEFADLVIARKLSEPFLMKTDRQMKANGGNGRLEDVSSPESFVSALSPCSSASNSGGPNRKRRKGPWEELNDVQFNKIEANEATIKHLIYETHSSKNRDFAYHVKLSNPEQYGHFEEGDVVVFLETDDNDSGIELLNAENREKATLVGVISRSYYRCAYPREDESKITDIVCIIGIVDVKVFGPVICGEHLYAAPGRSGVAIAQSNMSLYNQSSEGKPLLLGQALESKTDVRPDETVKVKSFVSVLLSIGRTAAERSVKDSEEKMKQNFGMIVEDASKKVKCRVLALKILLLITIAIVSLALWQRYAPNTLFRKSVCKFGSKNLWMVFRFSTSWEDIHVNCLEFEYQSLQSKLYKKIEPCPSAKCGNGTIRYFMNFDRCSNRGATFGNEFFDDTPTVSGPEIIGVDQHCKKTSMHYFVNGRWVNFMKRHKNSKLSIRHCP
eukprot:gene9962-10982_t